MKQAEEYHLERPVLWFLVIYLMACLAVGAMIGWLDDVLAPVFRAWGWL